MHLIPNMSTYIEQVDSWLRLLRNTSKGSILLSWANLQISSKRSKSFSYHAQVINSPLSSITACLRERFPLWLQSYENEGLLIFGNLGHSDHLKSLRPSRRNAHVVKVSHGFRANCK